MSRLSIPSERGAATRGPSGLAGFLSLARRQVGALRVGAGWRLSVLVATAPACLACGSPSVAQEPDADPSRTSASVRGVVSYPASYFASARPTTALDMIARLPGFSFDTGARVRGFAGTSGNVLIDSEHAASKSDALDAVLRRIPASTVERIDVVRDQAAGLDMRGHAVVANIVRRLIDARWRVTTGAVTYKSRGLTPQIGVDLGRSTDRVSADGSLSAYFGDAVDHTGRLELTDEAGRPLVRGRLTSDSDFRGLDLTGRREQQLSDGSRMRVNALYSGSSNRSDTAFRLSETAGQERLERYKSEAESDHGEVGAEYERAVGERWTLKGFASQSLSRSDYWASYASGGEAAVSSGASLAGESILRGTGVFQRSEAFSVELGAEAAYNVLDETFAFSVGGRPVELPSSTLRVEERRAEAFAEADWRLSRRWSASVASRLEVSRLGQSGDVEALKSFVFAKPRVLLSFVADADTDLRFRLEREVSQLNFSDFVSSIALDTRVVDAGNPDLEPQRAWTVEGVWERRFWRQGAATLSLVRSELEEVIDLIAIAGRFDAPGNIGRGRRHSALVKLSLPLDRWGAAGGLLRAEGIWRESRVLDPVTRSPRRLSGEAPFTGSLRFSQDVAAWKSTWGLEAFTGSESRSFRLNEVRDRRSGPRFLTYFEKKATPDLTLRIQAEPGGAMHLTRRTIYAGRRGGQIAAVEDRRSRSSPSLYLSLRRSF